MMLKEICAETRVERKLYKMFKSLTTVTGLLKSEQKTGHDFSALASDKETSWNHQCNQRWSSSRSL